MVDGCPDTTDAAIAKVIRVNGGGIVDLIVGDAFDVCGSVQTGVNRDGVATRRAGGVGERECLVVVRSGETTAGTGLASAHARPAVATLSIRLS